jgi:RepB DNA-primase from phage plasmid
VPPLPTVFTLPRGAPLTRRTIPIDLLKPQVLNSNPTPSQGTLAAAVQQQTSKRVGDTPTGKALAMLAAFASVGARVFDLSLTDLSGAPVKGLQRPGKSLKEMRRSIGHVLREAEHKQHNVIVRPRSATALLIQLDDFTAEKAAQVEPSAFMTVCTSPGNYQLWLAVSDGPQESEREAAKLFRTRVRRSAGADHSATGAVRIAGSKNFKQKYAPAFPLIELTRVDAGRTITIAALEKTGLLAPQKKPAIQPPAGVPLSVPRHKAQALGLWYWPNYQQSLRGAPRKGDGTPDRSLADFMWCKWALQRGHSIEQTAEKLSEVSAKAQERIRRRGDRGYTLLTARNAAAAVERDRERRPLVKRAARP